MRLTNPLIVSVHYLKRVSGLWHSERKPGGNTRQLELRRWSRKSKTIKSAEVHSNHVIKVGLNKESPADPSGFASNIHYSVTHAF